MKQQFRDELQTLTDKASDRELLVALGNMNGHIGSDREGLEECIGRYGRDNRNAEGKNLLQMCSLNAWMIANTWFEKRDSQLYTFNSDRSKTQIDMIIVRKLSGGMQYMDTKVIPSETVALQHKPVVATLRLERFGRKDLCSTQTRIRSGKLNGALVIVIVRFRREVLEQQPRAGNIGTVKAVWKGFKEVVVKTAERICGRARYGKKPDREEWWWTEEVQTAIEEKHETTKELELQPSIEARRRYKIAKTAAKWAVKQVKERAEDSL